MRICLPILTMLLLACGSKGMRAKSLGGDQPDTKAGNAQSAIIFQNLCKMMESCHQDLPRGTCLYSLSPIVGFAEKLGIQHNPMARAGEIVQLELDGDIVANLVVGHDCAKKILELNCNDPAVRDAYDPSHDPALAKTVNLPDALCARVFQGY